VGDALPCPQPNPVVPVSGNAPLDFRHYYTTPPWVYAWRDHLLLLMGDWDRVLKGVREGVYPGKELPAPIGGVRETARPCTHCKQPTVFTTARGRSVHPNCEGWVDTLTRDGMADLMDSIAAILPIKGVEEAPCLFVPALTLGAQTQTDSQS
jgi:hypothetical protein